MNDDYQALSHNPLSSLTRVAYRNFTEAKRISLDDAAISIMTDFQYTKPFLISSFATIDEIYGYFRFSFELMNFFSGFTGRAV